MKFTDQQITDMAKAMLAEANTFHQPARLYIDGEAAARGLVKLVDGWDFDEEGSLESFRILVRAAVAAI